MTLEDKFAQAQEAIKDLKNSEDWPKNTLVIIWRRDADEIIEWLEGYRQIIIKQKGPI